MPNEAVIEFIDKYDKFIITAHETPDGDALGSEYAMLLALRKLGKTARILNADPAPQKFAFVASGDEFEVLARKEQIPEDIGKYGLFILDVNDRGSRNTSSWITTIVKPSNSRRIISSRTPPLPARFSTSCSGR